MVGSFIAIKFGVFPLSLILYVALATFLANLFLTLLILLKASTLAKDLAVLFLDIVVVVGLTAIIHYLPEARPAFLLVYVPTIVFTATQSLSFGITSVIIVIISFATLLILEGNFLAMGTAWQIATSVSFLFLMILSFLANYFMEIVRRSKKQIQDLADLNKRLYQRSKTTSDQIVKNMREGLVVIDHNLEIVKYNKAFRQMINQKEDLTGQDIGGFPIAFAARLKAYLQHLIKDKIKSFSFKAKDQLKHIFDISITKIKLKERETGFLVILNQQSFPWGTVFDSATKAPLELAVVRLHQAESDRIVETRVTDRTGRFGFIFNVGEYYISVIKSGYTFPARQPGGEYQGGKFSIKSIEEGFIKLNVPMDKK